MSSDESELKYERAEDKIYQIATDKDQINWKSFLYQLIHDEGLDPWDIDLGILTHKYLEAMREVKTVDFDVSGKFLTIAVFLLKTKAENLVERDLRGIEEKIAQVTREDVDNPYEEWESLEALDVQLDELNRKKKREKYAIKIRNPIARKRKVNIFDLIKLLERTFEQSNKRRENFFSRNPDTEYEGPMYEKKPKDLKVIISELYELIMDEIGNKKGHVHFSHISKESEHKMDVLDKFIPLLHLHNQNKVYLKQEEHFGDIEIHKPKSLEDQN